MDHQAFFQSLLDKNASNLKIGIDQIRYELAHKGLSKTPTGVDIYLEESIDLLSQETQKTLCEIKTVIDKPKEWEPIRASLNQFTEEQCNSFYNFLVNDWERPSTQILNQLNLVKSSLKIENNTYIDFQKAKLSKREHLTKDIVKILVFGLAAGIAAFLLKIILSR